MSTLLLFPSRIKFTNQDGTLTPEALRAFQAILDRVGGVLGDSGTDTFAADTMITQSGVEQSLFLNDIAQVADIDQPVCDVTQPIPVTTLDELVMQLASPDVLFIDAPAYATASAPAYKPGRIYYDTTLGKLRVGGAVAYETITSV